MAPSKSMIQGFNDSLLHDVFELMIKMSLPLLLLPVSDSKIQ